MLHCPRSASPFARREVPKHVGHGTPARVTGEHGLFIVGGVAAFRFESLQKTDGGNIVTGLFMQPALSDPVRIGYPEIAGGFSFRLDIEHSSGKTIWSIAGCGGW